MMNVNDMPDAEREQIFADMKAASDRDFAEFESRLAEIQDRAQAMAERAARAIEAGIPDLGVLDWCRERIEIPDERVLSGWTTVGEVKAAHRSNTLRHAAIIDASLRAQLEARLTMDPTDLH